MLGIGLSALSDTTYTDLTEGQAQPLIVSAQSALTLSGLDQSLALDLTQFRQPSGSPKISCCIDGCRVFCIDLVEGQTLNDDLFGCAGDRG